MIKVEIIERQEPSTERPLGFMYKLGVCVGVMYRVLRTIVLMPYHFIAGIVLGIRSVPLTELAKLRLLELGFILILLLAAAIIIV